MKQNLDRIEKIFGIEYMDEIRSMKEQDPAYFHQWSLSKDQQYNHEYLASKRKLSQKQRAHENSQVYLKSV